MCRGEVGVTGRCMTGEGEEAGEAAGLDERNHEHILKGGEAQVVVQSFLRPCQTCFNDPIPSPPSLSRTLNIGSSISSPDLNVEVQVRRASVTEQLAVMLCIWLSHDP